MDNLPSQSNSAINAAKAQGKGKGYPAKSPMPKATMKRTTTGKPKAKDMPKYGMGNMAGANDNETAIRAKQNRLIHK